VSGIDKRCVKVLSSGEGKLRKSISHARAVIRDCRVHSYTTRIVFFAQKVHIHSYLVTYNLAINSHGYRISENSQRGDGQKRSSVVETA